MNDYNLELDKVAEKIKQENAKTVLIQLPDGLKPRAKEIKQELEKKTNASIMIWADSCFGACDLPSNIKADLLVHFGHSEWI